MTASARAMSRLATVTRRGFRNHHPFGVALRRFLLSRKALALLPDCGWLDGGCLVLSDALVRWSGGTLRPGGTLRAKEDRLFLDHAFAWIVVDGAPCILDGDGLQSEYALRRKLELLEHAPPLEVRYSDCSGLAVGILRDSAASDRLATLLERRFGPFTPGLIAPALTGAVRAPRGTQ